MEKMYVHIGDVKIGDTVLCPDGNIRTVSARNLKYSQFMGITLFGDSYHLGYKKVCVIRYKNYVAEMRKIYNELVEKQHE